MTLMTQRLGKFITEVYEKCNRSNLSLDADYNIWYTSQSRKLVILASDIDKYYQGYLNSHQTRADAIDRAVFRVVSAIDKQQAIWDKL